MILLKKIIFMMLVGFLFGCATNHKYIIEPPYEENIIKVMESTIIKTKISKPAKSFPFCRKIDSGWMENHSSLYILGLPIDLVILPYTAIYDLSSHYRVDRGIDITFGGQLITDSGLPIKNSQINIYVDNVRKKTAYTNFKGLFKVELNNLVIPSVEEMNIVLEFQKITDAYFETFSKGQDISVKKPFETNYLIDFSDHDKVIVTRKDKYLKAITSFDDWDFLKYEFKAVNSKFSTIIISDINLLSEKNKESEKWGEEFQFEETKGWKKINFDSSEALNCKKNSYNLQDIKVLMKSNIELKEIKNICRSISKQIKNKWGNYKFTWQEALKWSKDFSPKKAAGWKKARFAHKDALKWFRDFSPEEANKWKRKKFTFNEANKWRRFYNPVSALKIKKNCSKINSLPDLFQANPYAVKNKCYEFVGETLQIITKTTALFMQSGKVFYVDFKNNPAPNAWFNGIVKGEGVYSYTTRFGVKKTIPKLKMIVKK